MTYRVLGLDPAPVRDLYGLDDELAARQARRYTSTERGGFPDRVELRDLEPRETALLVNFVHQPGDSPFGRATPSSCGRAPSTRPNRSACCRPSCATDRCRCGPSTRRT